jgi:transposase
MRTITVTDKQQRQAEILTRLLAGRLSPSEAAQLLCVSARHLRRLKSRFEQEGIAALVHGNTGRAPTHKTDQEIVAQVQALAGAGGIYQGFNTCHLQEMLAERHGISLGRSTLDRLLKEQGATKPAKARQVRRQRRERKAAEGMLLQMDGSPHDWLEGRAPRLCLIGAIDDATGKVLYLRFHPSETQDAYLRMLRTIAKEHGLPMSAYHDKHTILRSPKKATIDDELAGTQPMSQVQRVMHQLGIESIAAQSPQAKGRIERLWQTLQDRLQKEMRLEGIGTQEAANAFLPAFVARFNTRFSQEAADKEPAWVALLPDLDVGYYFSVKEPRVVRADQTLSYLGRTLQLAGTLNLSGKRVWAHVTPEGELFVYWGKQRLGYHLVEASPSPGASPSSPSLPPSPPDSARATRAAAKRRAWLFGQGEAG